MNSHFLRFADLEPSEVLPILNRAVELKGGAPQPTARCTMATSSVSPDRADTIAPQPASRAASNAARVSVRVPAWLGFTSSVLQAPAATARRTRPANEVDAWCSQFFERGLERSAGSLEPCA